jgi:MFS family permease
MSATHASIDSRPTRVRYQVMAFICVLSFLTYYDRQCIVRAQESIQTALSLTDKQLGLVLGAFWLAYALFEIPGGWLGDRVGSRFTLTRIVLAWSLFTALTGAATGFVALLAYRFLFGVGEAGAYPNMARIQSRWLPQVERARFGGLLWLTARWGAAFAPLIFGELTRHVESWQTMLPSDGLPGWFASLPSWRIGFFMSGILGVIWCLMFYPWFRDEPRDKPSVNAAELKRIESGRVVAADGHHMDGKTWGRLFASPSLWAIALYYICGSFGWSFFVSWMPKYMKAQHGVSFESSELSTGLPLFCGGISCLVGGVLCDMLIDRTGWKRWGRAIFPIVGCTTAALAMLAIPHVSSEREATILLCIAAAAFDFGQAATWATIVDVGGRYAGSATGFINMVGNLGNAAQPFIGAIVFNAYGWSTLFGAYAAAFLLAMSMWAIINPKRQFYEA